MLLLPDTGFSAPRRYRTALQERERERTRERVIALMTRVLSGADNLYAALIYAATSNLYFGKVTRDDDGRVECNLTGNPW